MRVTYIKSFSKVLLSQEKPHHSDDASTLYDRNIHKPHIMKNNIIWCIFSLSHFVYSSKTKETSQHDLIRTADTLFKLQNIQNNDVWKKAGVTNKQNTRDNHHISP